MRKQEIMDLTFEAVVLEALGIESYTINDSYNYQTGLTEDQNFFNSIVCEDKPDIGSAMNLFTAHKAKLITDRKKEIEDFLNFRTNSHGPDALLQYTGGYKTGNYKTEVARIIEEDREAAFDTIKAVSGHMKTKGDAKEKKALRLSRGNKNTKICNDAIAFITDINEEKEMSDDQLDAVLSKYMDVMVTLQSFRPKKALKLIKLKTPDDNYTQEDLDEIIEFMESEIDGI